MCECSKKRGINKGKNSPIPQEPLFEKKNSKF